MHTRFAPVRTPFSLAGGIFRVNPHARAYVLAHPRLTIPASGRHPEIARRPWQLLLTEPRP